jgi:hypothetical protein
MKKFTDIAVLARVSVGSREASGKAARAVWISRQLAGGIVK